MAKLSEEEKWINCKATFLSGFKPPPNFSIAEWADKNRMLPASGSDESGPWRTSRTPYLREIMEELSPRSHTEEIVFMKGSQVGATEVLINTALFYIEHAPCPILFIEPTITVAKRVSKKRLQPSINLCENVAKKIGAAKSRDSGNTTLEKEFPGGTLTIGGANSAASMRSMPIKVFLADEIDGYPDDVDGEGDPLDLGDRRTTNFSRPKKLYISTPTTAEISKIEKKFQESDQRYYYVPCPFCGEKQIIKWENIIYDDHDAGSARLRCQHCKTDIHEHHKTFMLENGEWRKHNPDSDVAGFHLSALYSPLGWYSWKKAVREHLRAIGKPNKRKVWVNTVLGEVWDEAAISLDGKELVKRREIYPCEIPDPVLVLVSGGDVQDNRIEKTVLGIGWDAAAKTTDIWMIDHKVFYGDPKQQAVWDLVDQYMLREWKHESGITLNISASGFDAMGHCTDEVYAFCAKRAFRRVYAMQGKSGAGRPLVGKAFLSKRAKVYLYQIGVDQAKETIYSRLKIKDHLPGYIHFPVNLPVGSDGEKRVLDDSYFEQLTAEKRVLRNKSGMPKLYWELTKGKRNEALDCFGYSLAALNILSPNLPLLAKEKKCFRANYNRPSARPGRRVLSKGVTA